MTSWQPEFHYPALLCRYSEIGIKGENRMFFEERLLASLQRQLASLGPLRFTHDRGRIFVFPETKDSFTPADLHTLRREIPRIAGVASLSPGFALPPALPEIEKCLQKIFPHIVQAGRDKFPGRPLTYALQARRSDKSFPLHCVDIERYFAELLLPGYPDLTLDLRHAEIVIEVEVRKDIAFVSCERINGPGGLPCGSSGRVLALLSGGFDSPVACFQMMRRGCLVDFLTFHSAPFTPPATITKVCRLVRRLNEFQPRGRLVSINLLPLQLAIRDACQSRYRTVLYRRSMLRLGAVLAEYFQDQAIVTGDNLGQVASQTLANLSVIAQASNILVLRPLLAYDKINIMNMAQDIGTYDISRENVPDSCTVFATNNPATRAKLDNIKREEQKIPMRELLLKCLDSANLINAKNCQEYPFPELKNYGQNMQNLLMCEIW